MVDLQTDQWNGIKGPEINPYIYSQLILNQDTKAFQWGKNILFNTWIYVHAKERSWTPNRPYTNTN